MITIIYTHIFIQHPDFSVTVRGCRNFQRRQRRAEWRQKEVASTGSEADGLGTDTCRDRAVGSGIESRFLDSGGSQHTKQEDQQGLGLEGSVTEESPHDRCQSREAQARRGGGCEEV